MQDPDNEEIYASKYRAFDEAYRDFLSHLPPDEAHRPRVEPAPGHHYASHYSNSGGVLHYLVRVPPYTQQSPRKSRRNVCSIGEFSKITGLTVKI